MNNLKRLGFRLTPCLTPILDLKLSVTLHFLYMYMYLHLLLRKIGISDLFYNIIKQMYSHTELSVKVDADTCTCTKNVV
jgi:hypothetical protein